ncbi:aminoacyl-tRNA hydrolase [Melioribacteraceae bacterium 4301-Me]|uniref:aminoacyl-tRNA hydrolase n=1 Tax=Pyranulibacter aquaticus TaxID=3163344 RepID=UPI0035976319
MKAVIGIGNLGKKYELTRHNIGFIILDYFAEKHKLFFKPSKNNFYFASGNLNAANFLLVKPTTYVNQSGIAALEVIENFNIKISDLLVVVDDIHLELGKIRIRKSGSDGGHNGLKSIIYHLQTNNFHRLRFGIGNDYSESKLANYVLSKFSHSELNLIKKYISFSVELIEEFIKKDINKMLDYYSKYSKDIYSLNKPDAN